MATINDLELSDVELPVPDYDDIPEEKGEYVPPPQPGDYAFTLPARLDNVFDVIEWGADKAPRVQAVLARESALTLHTTDGDRTFSAWINNAERPRGKEKVPVSDLTYLIRALNPTATPKTNKEFATEFAKHGGRKFKASVTWSAFCSPTKDAYFPDPSNPGTSILCAGTPGCGKNYYQQDIPKQGGVYQERFQCTCGATLRAFPKLRNFRPL